MATLLLLPATGFRRMPWKNGGGETIEIAAFPDGAGLDTFAWRISMAKVASSGPFSIFPGIDRTLSVLEGAAIDLAFAGRSTVRLERGSVPYSFPADLAVSGEVSGAGIIDLNVMSRRGVARHHVSQLRLDDPVDLTALGDTLMVLSLETAISIRTGGQTLPVSAGDAVLVTNRGGGELHLETREPTEIFLIDLWH